MIFLQVVPTWEFKAQFNHVTLQLLSTFLEE
jgi:hypothetical protein